MKLTHTNQNGEAQMVDISEKPITHREAIAKGCIWLKDSTIDAIAANNVQKGDVLAAARIAGIIAAKRCADIIPLCHTLPLSSIAVDLQPYFDPPRIEISAEAKCDARTGAEMEALLAVSVAALTIYDMVKAIDKCAVIGEIKLAEKSGGKSGHFVRKDRECRQE